MALACLLLGAAVLHPAWALRGFPVIVHLALFWVFARTLRRGREPIISRIARLERGALDAELARYTRRLTLVWALMFLALGATSLYFALIANLAGLVLGYVPVAVLFFGEHVYRRIRYPQYEHTSPWRVIRRIRELGALNR
ncbi:MAG: hypothetical protein ACREV9_00735 [Burkholderiales bacterium]